MMVTSSGPCRQPVTAHDDDGGVNFCFRVTSDLSDPFYLRPPSLINLEKDSLAGSSEAIVSLIIYYLIRGRNSSLLAAGCLFGSLFYGLEMKDWSM